MKTPAIVCMNIAVGLLLTAAVQPLRAQSVSGRINQWGNHAQGIQQVLVRAFRQDTAKQVGETLTDDQGKYEIGALPTGVAIEVRFEKDHYLRRPLVWQTTLASNDAHATYDDQMCAVRPGARGEGPKFDPQELAKYLKAESANALDREAYYCAQWKSLEEFHLTPTTLAQVAMALVQEDPDTLKLPEIKAAKEARATRLKTEPSVELAHP